MTYESEVLADSPAAWWPLQGAAAAAVLDAIGNDDLTLHGGPAVQRPGPHGWDSILFDGTINQWAISGAAGNPALLLNNPTLTLELWFRIGGSLPEWSVGTIKWGKPVPDHGNNCTIGTLRTDIDGGRDNALLHWLNQTTRAARGYRMFDFRTASAGSWDDGLWHHRVDVTDGVTYWIYMDGALLVSGTPAGTNAQAIPLFAVLGGNIKTTQATANQPFPGAITQVAAYPSALSAARVAAHFAAAGT